MKEFKEICFDFILGDGICDCACNDKEHYFDNGDCVGAK